MIPLDDLVPPPTDATGRLAAVLRYCDEHGLTGDEPPWDELTCRSHDDGTVTVAGDAPAAIAVSFGVLDSDLYRLSWAAADGALVVDVTPEPLRYRPVHLDWLHRYVVCRRVATAYAGPNS